MAYLKTCFQSWIHVHARITCIFLLPVFICLASDVHATPEIDIDARISEMLVAQHHKEDVRQFLNENLDQILKNQRAIIKAMILARNNQHYYLALEIADKALEQGLKTERLFYEIGLVYLLAGNCLNASVIFNGILRGEFEIENEPSNAWLIKESQQALKLCRLPKIWIYDYDFGVGFSNNLAGVTPARTVRPEKGSPLGRYLNALRETFPDLQEEFVIGEKPKHGMTVTTNQYLDQYHHNNGADYVKKGNDEHQCKDEVGGNIFRIQHFVERAVQFFPVF